MKKLERGLFAKLWRELEVEQFVMTTSELVLFIEGFSLVGRVILSPQEVLPMLVAQAADM